MSQVYSIHMQTVVFGGGCFWCTEAIFQQLKGVTSVTSGYAGGELADPGYHDVTTGNTGHAEVIKVEFDETVIPLKDLVEVFFNTHNPTSVNRQGNDVGTQYRSVIFYTTEEQKVIAQQARDELITLRQYEGPIVTEIEPLKEFYPAEQYHQDYYNKNKTDGYCEYVISPKLQKLREKYSEKLK